MSVWQGTKLDLELCRSRISKSIDGLATYLAQPDSLDVVFMIVTQVPALEQIPSGEKCASSCGCMVLIIIIIIIRHHQTSSDIIRHHQTSSDIIRHHQTSSDIIIIISRHHQTSSDIIRHHQTSSDIIRHHHHHHKHFFFCMIFSASPSCFLSGLLFVCVSCDLFIAGLFRF